MFHEAEVSHGGGNICDIRSPVAQQRCGRSRPPTLLRCWAVQAIARQVRVADRLTDRLISIIIISKQKKTAVSRKVLALRWSLDKCYTRSDVLLCLTIKEAIHIRKEGQRP